MIRTVVSGIGILAMACGLQPAAADSFEPDVLRDPQALMAIIAERMAPREGHLAARGDLSVFTVGPTIDCNFDNLQTAILNTPADAELRVVSGNVAGGSISLPGKSDYRIIGGYSSCASTSPSDRTTINASSGRALTIFQGTQPEPGAIELTNLDLTGGDVDGDGGGVVLSGDYRLVLDNTRIENNTTTANGGGLAVVKPSLARVEITNQSFISNNTADGDGGGLWCGASSQIFLDRSSISNNQATSGGGAYLTGGCTMQSYAGEPDGGIFANTASTGQGGGIYVDSDAQFFLTGQEDGSFGDVSIPALVSNNAAILDPDDITSVDGGGIFNAGLFFAINGSIRDNSTELSGGGLLTTGTAAITGLEGGRCPFCSVLARNSANGAGGAVAVDSGGSLAMTRTVITENVALWKGSAIGMTSDQPLYLESNLFIENEGPNVLLIATTTSTSAEIAWSTFSDNTGDLGEMIDQQIELDSASSGSVSLSLHGNIHHDPGTPILTETGGGTFLYDEISCLLVHDDASLPPGDLIVVGDPQFVNPVFDDYSLQQGSPALDVCDDRNSPPAQDILGNPRGQPAGGTAPFVYDLGALELNTLIFSDRFETP